MRLTCSISIKNNIKTILQTRIFPAIYLIALVFHREIDENLAVFADAHHTSIPISMVAMKNKMLIEGYRVLELYHDYTHEPPIRSLTHGIEFMWHYASAKYVFVSDNFLPVSSCKKRKETRVIQLWHSCGMLKKMGYDASDSVLYNPNSNIYANYDLITCSSKQSCDCLASAMRLPSKLFVATGVSRTDRYFSKEWKNTCVDNFYAKFPGAIDKKIILWAPTFRGRASNPSLEGLEAIKLMGNQLGDEWLVLIKVHPHIDAYLLSKGENRISNVEISTEELLPVIDILITDYSSVLCESFFFQIPFVLYAPDIKQMIENGGFYTDYYQLGPYITGNAKELTKLVTEAYEKGIDNNHMERLFQDHCGACDGESTNRIFEIKDA